MKLASGDTTRLTVEQAEEFGKAYQELAQAHVKTKEWRVGQALYNALYRVSPDIAKGVTNSNNDPFNVDANIPAFYAAVLDKSSLDRGPEYFNLPLVRSALRKSTSTVSTDFRAVPTPEQKAAGIQTRKYSELVDEALQGVGCPKQLIEPMDSQVSSETRTHFLLQYHKGLIASHAYLQDLTEIETGLFVKQLNAEQPQEMEVLFKLADQAKALANKSKAPDLAI